MGHWPKLGAPSDVRMTWEFQTDSVGFLVGRACYCEVLNVRFYDHASDVGLDGGAICQISGATLVS